MSLFIGIEGVGVRQSVAVIGDAQGRILASCRMRGEPLTLHGSDRNLLRTRLLRLMREASRLADARLSDLGDATICIGIDGVNRPFDAAILHDEFAQLEVPCNRLICTGDAEIILASHATSLSGSVILCSIGSTAYIRSADCRVRIGGWGPAVSDPGSGYWIGMEALRAVIQGEDRLDQDAGLWQRMDEWLLGQRTLDYPDWQLGSIVWSSYRERLRHRPPAHELRAALLSFANQMTVKHAWEWRAIVAGLTMPVMAAWQAGDSAAEYILARAATRIVNQFRQACHRADSLRRPLDEASKVGSGEPHSCRSPLVLYGGVLVHNPAFRDRVLTEIASFGTLPNVVLGPASPGTMRPACGALLLALGDSTTGDLRLPTPDIIEKLSVDQRMLHCEGDLKND